MASLSSRQDRFARVVNSFLVCGLLLGLMGCEADLPLTDERYSNSDALFHQVAENVAANSDWDKVTEIDHSRLGMQAGSVMPPSRVFVFSDPVLETSLIQQAPLVALDLPLRILAYEESPGGKSKLIYNQFSFLQSRYDLPEQLPAAEAYEASIQRALAGVSVDSIGAFPSSTMDGDGIITIESDFGFDETLARILAAIASQDDTVSFGMVDFKQQAQALNVELLPNTMILFGAPEPGAKAMSESPTLGLDAFCQKFLVWQDVSGKVHLSFNDLLWLAESQNVSKSLPLRVINFRLNKVFSEALEH